VSENRPRQVVNSKPTGAHPDFAKSVAEGMARAREFALSASNAPNRRRARQYLFHLISRYPAICESTLYRPHNSRKGLNVALRKRSTAAAEERGI
jgi:hypothetical protein